jgi:hypothetical protein
MNKFLPITGEDAEARGWDTIDYVLVTGDAYVDHPSFGAAIVSRVLEAEGFRVSIIAQPNIIYRMIYRNLADLRKPFL